MTETLEAVRNHLRSIASRVAAAATREDIEEIRRIIEDYGALNERVTQVEGEAVSVDADGTPGEWMLAENSRPNRRMLYVHGGSWMSGTARGYRPHTARLAAVTGCSVLAIDYRLMPENAFPAGLDDCISSFNWMRHHGPEGPRAAETTFIAGDSAGGNLTLATLLALRDRSESLPARAAVFSPATDLTWGSESFTSRAAVEPVLIADRLAGLPKAYLQDRADPSDPYVSPLFGDFSGIPPLLVQVGDHEILLDDSTRLADRARQHGCSVELSVWPEMPHVFQLFAPDLPQANQALEAVGRFFTESNRSGE